MELRQELFVFLGVAAIIGGLLFKGDSKRASSRTRASSGSAVLERYPTPDLERSSEVAVELRPLFSPPRDTRPLDPPSFEEPPAEPFPMLAPPSSFGPGPAEFAAHLQRPAMPVGQGELYAGEFESDGPDAGGEVLDSQASGSSSSAVGATSWSDLDRTERLEVTESFKKRYDWMRENEVEVQFGRILNEEPFGLRTPVRSEEPIRFLILDPFSGAPRFPEPIEFARERVIEFALADTPRNRIREAYHGFNGTPTPGTYAQQLMVADECLELRFEFEEALDLAEELYGRCRDYRPDEPAPVVGLARTHVASLEFDQAFTAFRLATESFPSRAEPWIGLGELQARFLDFDGARASFETAVRLEPAEWEATGAFGRFLLERGEPQAALQHLRKAVANLPVGVGRGDLRLALRLALGEAQLRTGRIAEARATFAQAARVIPGEGSAEAGLAACARLLGEPLTEASRPELGQVFGGRAGARWLVADALSLIDAAEPGAGEEELAQAKLELERAITLDPLGQAEALRALAWLAFVAGAPEAISSEATEAALAADPTSAWVLFHRGRLAHRRGDLELAELSLRAALERNAGFEDAVAALARLAYERGDHAAAERYIERALALVAADSPANSEGVGPARQRVDLVTLRGQNSLAVGAVREAREVFREALTLDSTESFARGGLAWCELLLGNGEEAIIQLRNMDDARRDRPENDPLRVWAMRQIERIEENRSRDVWNDRFEYSRIGNGWLVDDAAGPEVALAEGQLTLNGSFLRSGTARFYREVSAAEFVAFEADLWVGGDSSARIGLIVARESRRASGTETQAMVALARARDGSTQVRSFDAGQADTDWLDLDSSSFPFPADAWVHLRIELVGEGNQAVVNVLFDGVPVLERRSATGLARGNAPLVVGLFSEGETGRTATARLDDVEITRKIR